MKKKFLVICMAVMLVLVSSISVMAKGYVCDTCGSTTGVYDAGCKGIEYDRREDQYCATHRTNDLTLIFYESYTYCLDCDAYCDAEDAAHLHEQYDGTTGLPVYFCRVY